MELIDDFKKKYPRYWSVWLHGISGVCAVLELINDLGQVLPFMENRFDPGTFAALSAGFALAGLVARAIKQSGLAGEQSDGTA